MLTNHMWLVATTLILHKYKQKFTVSLFTEHTDTRYSGSVLTY